MNKYRAVKVKTKDGVFDSKAEYARWVELRLLEKAGKITELRRQVPFPLYAYLAVSGVQMEIGKYVADFIYLKKGKSIPTVEDVKGVLTPIFRWKAKHFEIQYGFPITLIGLPKKRSKKNAR